MKTILSSVFLLFFASSCFYSYREAATRDDYRYYLQLGGDYDYGTKPLEVHSRKISSGAMDYMPNIAGNLRLSEDFNLTINSMIAPPYAGGGGLQPSFNILYEKYNKPALMVYGDFGLYNAKFPAVRDTTTSSNVSRLRAGFQLGKTIKDVSVNLGYHAMLESTTQYVHFDTETRRLAYCASHGPELTLGLPPMGSFRFVFSGEYNYQRWSLKSVEEAMTYSTQLNRSDIRVGAALQYRLGSKF